MMMSAPARWMAARASRAAPRSSKAPARQRGRSSRTRHSRCRPRGNVDRRPHPPDHVEAGQSRLDHDHVGPSATSSRASRTASRSCRRPSGSRAGRRSAARSRRHRGRVRTSPTRTSRCRRGSRSRRSPPRRGRPGSPRPGRPSCRSGDDVRPGPGLGDRRLRIEEEGCVVVHRPVRASTPQWPWSVYSSRQQSAIERRSRRRTGPGATAGRPGRCRRHSKLRAERVLLRVGTPRGARRPGRSPAPCSTVAPCYRPSPAGVRGGSGWRRVRRCPRDEERQTREERLSRVLARRAGAGRGAPQAPGRSAGKGMAAPGYSPAEGARHRRGHSLGVAAGRHPPSAHGAATRPPSCCRRRPRSGRGGRRADGSDDGVHRAGTEQRHGVKAFREGGDQEAAQPGDRDVR